MNRLAILLMLALPLAAPAQSVTLPKEVRGAVGAWLIVAPEVLDGGQPEWEWDERLQLVPLDLLLPPEFIVKLKGKVFTATAPGRYEVRAWNAKGDKASKLSRCIVVVGDPGPTPPPGPGPAPPPVPSDPFVKALQAAYDVDPEPQKARYKTDMATVFRAAVSDVNDPQFKTAGQLQEFMRAAMDRLIGNRLVPLRKVVFAEVLKVWPSESTQLDTTIRDTTVATFQRIAKALDQVK